MDSDVLLVELLKAADELELTELVNYVEGYIISMPRECFQQNLIRVFNPAPSVNNSESTINEIDSVKRVWK